jgi:hypothetical protein
METVDNGVILAIPSAMEAGLTDPLFWGSLALGLGMAWVVAFPVNRRLLSRARAKRWSPRTTPGITSPQLARRR